MIEATAPQAPARRPLSTGERFKRWRHHNRQAVEGWAILTPILIYFSVFTFIPVAASLLMSFAKWSGLSGAPVWVGFANYQRYLTDKSYLQVIVNTVGIALAILLVQTVLAFFVALLLNSKIKARGVFRAAWYIPTLTSAAIMAQVATIFIAPNGGVINEILLGMNKDPIFFYAQVDWMRVIIVVYSVWRGVGGPIIMYLAALQGIHPELYEAAQVDGATGPQLLRYITLPLITPMTIFVLVTGIIGTAQIFEAVMFLSKGGPRNQTNVLMLQIYQDAFQNQSLGMAGSGSIILGLILLVFSMFNIRIMSRGRVGE
jgi:ABC-type sugar transport system permease subunit